MKYKPNLQLLNNMAPCSLYPRVLLCMLSSSPRGFPSKTTGACSTVANESRAHRDIHTHLSSGRDAKAQPTSQKSATIETENTETQQPTRRRTGRRSWINNLDSRRRIHARRSFNFEKFGNFIGGEQVFRLNVPYRLTFDFTVYIYLRYK